MAHAENVADVFGQRLSQAGADLFPLQQLVLNQQRQSAQEEFTRATQLQQFRNQAEQLRQGRERLDISQQRLTEDIFQARQPRVERGFAPPTTLSGVAARLIDAGASIDDPQVQRLLTEERTLRRAPQTAVAAPEETAAVETVQDITKATRREHEARRAFSRLGLTQPLLDTSGQPIPALAPETERQVLDEFGRPAFQEEPAPFPGPFTDTAQIIRQGLFGQQPGFETEQFLETIGQISPQLGGFIGREGIGADFEPAQAREPVNLFGFESPQVAPEAGEIPADLQQQLQNFDNLTADDKRSTVVALLALDPEFEELTEQEKQQLIDGVIEELEQ